MAGKTKSECVRLFAISYLLLALHSDLLYQFYDKIGFDG